MVDLLTTQLDYRYYHQNWTTDKTKTTKDFNDMDNICIRAYAKVNLTLDVVGKRADDYHDLEMIMQSVDLWDQIILREIHSGIELDTNIEDLPRDEGNIAWRAAQLIKKEFDIATGVHIFIQKNIPLEGGMAGGSADCAGVLAGLNQLWNLGMDEKELRALGKSLGADVPFCLMGGTALAQGIGDILTPIESKEDMWLLVVKPQFGVSTRDVYNRLNLKNIGKRPDNKRMVEYLESGRIEDLARGLVNVLEEITIPMHPEISQLKAELIELGSLGSLMSGSGPSVYGIYKDHAAANRAAKGLSKKYKQVYLIKTREKGIDIEFGY